MKTIFHIDETATWSLALGNARNLVRYCREAGLAYEIEVLANGPAVTSLVRGTAERQGIASDLEALRTDGVVLAACRNALRGHGIGEDTLYPGVVVVPSGVAELSLKQAEGYAYIKP